MTLKPRKRKVDATGRNKGAGFVKLDYGLLDTEAWKHLSPDATKVLIDMWRRHNGSNNGEISYSAREAHGCLMMAIGRKVSMDRATKGLRELQDKGFVVVAQDSTFTIKTKQARTWRLAEAVEDRETVATFLRKPLADQAAALAGRPETTTRRDLATEGRMQRAHAALVKQIKDGQGLIAAVELGVISELDPLDVSKPEALPETLRRRALQARMASDHFGVPVTPLLAPHDAA